MELSSVGTEENTLPLSHSRFNNLRRKSLICYPLLNQARKLDNRNSVTWWSGIG